MAFSLTPALSRRESNGVGCQWGASGFKGVIHLDQKFAHDGLPGAGGWGHRYREFSGVCRRRAGADAAPGDVVVMDNLSPHKSDPTLALITQAGAEVLFRPADSPELNPIEKKWSKVKARLRAAEARMPGDLVKAIGQALAQVTPQDALGWFVSCGCGFC